MRVKKDIPKSLAELLACSRVTGALGQSPNSGGSNMSGLATHSLMPIKEVNSGKGQRKIY
jgi:hypothetical protein